jgi:hypothetical protein
MKIKKQAKYYFIYTYVTLVTVNSPRWLKDKGKVWMKHGSCLIKESMCSGSPLSLQLANNFMFAVLTLQDIQKNDKMNQRICQLQINNSRLIILAVAARPS